RPRRDGARLVRPPAQRSTTGMTPHRRSIEVGVGFTFLVLAGASMELRVRPPYTGLEDTRAWNKREGGHHGDDKRTAQGRAAGTAAGGAGAVRQGDRRRGGERR